MAILSGMVRLQLCDFILEILVSRRLETIETKISLQKVWSIRNRFQKPQPPGTKCFVREFRILLPNYQHILVVSIRLRGKGRDSGIPPLAESIRPQSKPVVASDSIWLKASASVAMPSTGADHRISKDYRVLLLSDYEPMRSVSRSLIAT